MTNKDKISNLLKKNNFITFNLKDMKNMSENACSDKIGLKELLKTIEEFYIFKINEKVPIVKISELGKDKLLDKLKKKKNITDKVLENTFYTFLFSLVSFLLTGFILDYSWLFYINQIVCFATIALVGPVICFEVSGSKAIIKRAEEKLIEEGVNFKDIIREVTIETVNNIKNYDEKLYSDKKKENLISFLVEENYFLEKDKKNSIFENIKKKSIEAILEGNKNSLESKNIKNMEITLEDQLNFLLEKNQLSIQKDKDQNNILN